MFSRHCERSEATQWSRVTFALRTDALCFSSKPTSRRTLVKMLPNAAGLLRYARNDGEMGRAILVHEIQRS